MAIINYSYGSLVESFSLIVGDDDPVNVSLNLKAEKFPISVIFKKTLNPATNAGGVNWRTEGGVVHFTFYAWDDALGVTLQDINTKIGVTAAGEPLYIIAAHHKIGPAHHLTMQIVLGHPDGGVK